jgi:hypothetical protein
VALAHQHICPGFFGSLALVLDARCARVSLDERGIAKLANGLLYCRVQANPGLEGH